MTSLDMLYAAVGLVAVVGAVVPVVRARRRWRRLFRPAAAARGRPAGPEFARGIVRQLHGRWPLLAGAGCVSGLAFILSGPIAGTVLACYAVAAIVLIGRRSTARDEARSRVGAVDAVAALAAELRAGLAVGPALANVRANLHGPAVVGAGAKAVVARLTSAVDLAETSGAPLADVLDRLDAHLRAAERARATAEAQAAGAMASAALLAVMPVAGAGLGALVGLDPAQVLLHTPIGAACLCGAVILQLAGLAWSVRLSRVEVAA